MTFAPDPRGQAALMLCESLACLLIERDLVSAEQVVGAIEDVIEARRELAGASERVVVSAASITLLRTVAQSLSAASAPPARTGA